MKILAFVLIVPLVACGGDDEAPAPTVQRFVAMPAEVQQGGIVRLHADYSDGSGMVDRGVGAVASGAPVDVAVSDDTVFTLTVAGRGEPATATARATVVYDRQWDFTGAEDWVIQSGDAGGGRLTLRTHLSPEPAPTAPPWQGCAGARAQVGFGDAKLAAGRYATVVIEFVGLWASGRSAIVRYEVVNQGRRITVDPGTAPAPPGRNVRIEWRASAVQVFFDGIEVPAPTPQPSTAANGLQLQSTLCPQVGDPGGDSQVMLDAVRISAR